MSQSNAPRRIGVSGYMGAGKSTCAALLCRVCGMRCVDADAEAKQLTESDDGLKDEIVRAFGRPLVRKGVVDFRALGEIAFSSTGAMETLNRIVHPGLVRRLLALTSAAAEPLVLDAALIPMWGMADSFDLCLWITAGRDIRLARVCAKTGLSDVVVKQRMLVQEALMAPPSGPRWRLIDNEGAPEQLAEAVKKILAGGP